MKKQGSSYSRLFRSAIIIILCVEILLGAVISGVSSSICQKNELNHLKNSGDLFISVISDYYDADNESFLENSAPFGIKLAQEQSIRLYLYDGDGRCLISPDSDPIEASPISASMKNSLDNDDYLDISSEFFSQSVPALIYGSKFFLRESGGMYVPYYVLAYTTTESTDNFTMAILLIYSTIAVIIFIFCYLILHRKTKEHDHFESEFLRITEKYCKGDFSEKLSTDISPNLKHISDLVNVLASNVEKSEEISSTFIANVSHELRTPMTTIGGFVDGILDGTIKKSRQQEYLVLVSQEIQRLRILITSMLNMSKFESGTMIPNFQETNLTDLVIKVVLMFEKRIEEKDLNVEELDSSRLTAVVDPDLMQQVVYNLVENAVKFVNKGGTLSFSFEKNNDICCIGIRNTGEGLKDSEIQQVFDRFYKTDSSRGKDTTGLGLGLSISRKIVHLHNGHIVVKSVYGEYTEFQIQIPEDPRQKEKK